MDFPIGWASLVTAIAAIIQPWAIRLWEKYFRIGIIDIHEAGLIEIGFTSAGPIIGLMGTLRALQQDHFVRSIRLTLIKQRDSSRHLFEWVVLRPARIVIGSGADTSVEIPTSFMLTTVQPFKFHIQFYEPPLQSEIGQHVDRVSQAWQQHLARSNWQFSTGAREQWNNLVSEFAVSPVPQDERQEIDRLCYWEPGRYFLEMAVVTARPDKTFTQRWMFALSQAQSQGLRFNVLKVVWDAHGASYGQYRSEYVSYQHCDPA